MVLNKSRRAFGWFVAILTIVTFLVVFGTLSWMYPKETHMKKTLPYPNYDPPLFQVLPQFLTEAECNALIKQSKPRLKPAMVGMKTQSQNDSIRNNSVCFLPRKSSTVVRSINERLSALLNIPVSHFEDIQVGHYKKGEFYKKHSDDALEVRTNPRSFTLLMYLNDVKKGGETEFPNLGLRAIPRRGNAILFRPVEKRDGKYHSLNETVHEALTIEEGEKWIATIWVHFQPR